MRAVRSRVNTSVVPLVSPATRLLAKVVNATMRPSPDIEGLWEPALASAPPVETLTRSVLGVQDGIGMPFDTHRSRTKMSEAPFESPATSVVAALWNTTNRPSSETPPADAAESASRPAEDTVTRSVNPSSRSRMKPSATPFVSDGTRLLASLLNVTKRPSLDSPPNPQTALASVLLDVRLTRSVLVLPTPASSK